MGLFAIAEIAIAEVVNSVKQTGNGALRIVNNDYLDLIGIFDSIYLSDLHSKDENDNLKSSGTAVLLRFDIFLSLENYIRSVYYNDVPLILYFQIQLMKSHGILNSI